jgi:hypothetical protein
MLVVLGLLPVVSVLVFAMLARMRVLMPVVLARMYVIDMFARKLVLDTLVV